MALELSSDAFPQGEPIPERHTCDGQDVSPPLSVAGVPPEPHVLDGARQGQNDFGDPGWGGPCPPSGEEHRYVFYVFHLYALDARPELDAGATKAELLEATGPHLLEETRLTGRYRRA